MLSLPLGPIALPLAPVLLLIAIRGSSWLASRFRWLTPRRQAGWTSVRTPIQPAPKRLRDLIKERN